MRRISVAVVLAVGLMVMPEAARPSDSPFAIEQDQVVVLNISGMT